MNDGGSGERRSRVRGRKVAWTLVGLMALVLAVTLGLWMRVHGGVGGSRAPPRQPDGPAHVSPN